jgi:ubiquinone/menaquinone biosynthesis C-methylase UbiE
MILNVSEDKILYTKEPEDAVQYINQLDRSYSKFAKFYDIAIKILPLWKTWIKSIIPYIEGEKVLEVSFGTGYLLTFYADKYETYGIDYSHKMVEVANANLKRKGIQANLQQANVESIPFPDGYFDSIVNTMAFTGYPKGKQAMSEFYRVLKRNGKLLIVDFDYPSNRNWFGFMLTRMMECAGDTIKDIAKFLQDYSFEFSDHEIGGFGSVHLFVARKT